MTICSEEVTEPVWRQVLYCDNEACAGRAVIDPMGSDVPGWYRVYAIEENRGQRRLDFCTINCISAQSSKLRMRKQS